MDKEKKKLSDAALAPISTVAKYIDADFFGALDYGKSIVVFLARTEATTDSRLKYGVRIAFAHDYIPAIGDPDEVFIHSIACNAASRMSFWNATDVMPSDFFCVNFYSGSEFNLEKVQDYLKQHIENNKGLLGLS